MAPVVHGLEAEYAGRVGFIYLDVDDQATDPFKEALPYYNAVPQFLLINGKGRPIRQWFGAVDDDVLRQAFDQALQP